MVGHSPGVVMAEARREHRLVVGVPGQRHGGLQRQPGHLLAELGGGEQGASWRAGGHVSEGAPGEGAQAVLKDERARGGEGAPLDQLASADLTLREGPHDLGAVVARPLRFPLSDARSLLRYIHGSCSPAARIRVEYGLQADRPSVSTATLLSGPLMRIFTRCPLNSIVASCSRNLGIARLSPATAMSQTLSPEAHSVGPSRTGLSRSSDSFLSMSAETRAQSATATGTSTPPSWAPTCALPLPRASGEGAWASRYWPAITGGSTSHSRSARRIFRKLASRIRTAMMLANCWANRACRASRGRIAASGVAEGSLAPLPVRTCPAFSVIAASSVSRLMASLPFSLVQARMKSCWLMTFCPLPFTPTRWMVLAPMVTSMSGPRSLITTLVAKVAAVMPSALMSSRSWPPPGLASKPAMTSLPKPGANEKMSLPFPPSRESLPVPPSRESLPPPPTRASLPPPPLRPSLPAPLFRVSLPAPPSMRSLPRLSMMVSLPPPPNMTSL